MSTQPCEGPDPEVRVTIAWGDADDEKLVIGPDCPEGGGLWWNSLVLPDWSYRYTYAPPSAWIPGQKLISVTPDMAAVAVTIAARGISLAGLQSRKNSLQNALAHWPFVLGITAVTETAETVIGSWYADPVMCSWGPVTPQRTGLMVAETNLSIPVQPTGAP